MKRAALLGLLLVAGCASWEKKIIATDKAPAAIGPYSQAVQVGNVVFLAGQIALDPATGKMVEGGIEAETHQVMKNLSAVLEAAGLTFDDVVQTQAFLKDLNHYGKFNGIYAEYMGDNRPARAVVEAARIPKDALVEVMMTAVRSK